MPGSSDILESLALIANGAAVYAIAWHVAVAAGLLSLLAGSRIQQRVAALLFCLPLASVASIAWVYGNPFNGVVFTALTLALVWLAFRAPNADLTLSGGWPGQLGWIMIVFAWVYPHFLDASWSPFAYAYAAPMGLLPCPTLSLVVGLTLVCGAPAGRAFANTVAGAGVFYGVWGVARLGVVIDLVLLAGSAGLFFAAARQQFRAMRST